MNFFDTKFDENDIRSLVVKVNNIGDGLFNAQLSTNRILNVNLCTVDDDGLELTSIVESLQVLSRVESELINYGHLHKQNGHIRQLNPREIWSEICQRLGITYVLMNTNNSTNEILLQDDLHLPHFLPVICVIRLEKSCRIVYHAFPHKELLSTFALFPRHNFSPHSQVFNLLVYQLIQIYDAFASRSIYPILSPHVLHSDENLWLSMGLHLIFQKNCFTIRRKSEKSALKEQIQLDPSRLWELTDAWRNRAISNFEYLMKLNEFSGHVKGDPHRHPIFPWISDFKNETSLRPLNRTKYRLAKGDAQLNEQYSKQHPAHHVPEFLSDICYMVYRARIETKDGLCQVVRSQWVPEEYPSSMSRLYDWTPDECTPEFFEDPNIFISTHPDMSDLQLPEWTKTPAEFINWHKDLLESDEISGRLHEWIDLVFGYLLTGENAINALNVQLSIVQKPSARLRTHGAVQLFTSPHPKRMLTKPAKVSLLSHPNYNPAYCNFSSVQTIDTVAEDESFDLSGLLHKLYTKHILQIEGKNSNENRSVNIEEQVSLIWNLVEYEELNSLCNNQLKRVIPAIAKLFEGILPGSAKIFDRRFLLQLSIRFGSEIFFAHFLPPIIEAILSHSEMISSVAKESILWLARRYGPVVTATQITTSLLRLLALCYSQTSNLQPDYEEMSLDVTVSGDTLCEYILDCLVEIAVIYGPAFITMQYIPYCADLVDQAIRRLTSPLESAIISAMLLLKVSCDCLSDKQIMDHLQELIIDQVLFPAIRLLSSTNFTFSSERHRKLFTCKTIRSLHLLACRIGAENVQRYMFGVIQRLFCTFNLVYDLEESDHGGEPRVLIAENAPKQLISTFTPGFARLLIQIFSAVCGRQYITGSLPNATLISKLASGPSSTSFVNSMSPSLPISIGSPTNFLAGFNDNFVPFSSSPVLSSSPMLSSSMSGNRLTLFTVGAESPDLNQGILASSFDPTSNLTLNQKMRDVGLTHLAGTWIDRFRSALSSTSERISFDQIQLCTFTGHSSTVRKIITLDNENSFVSASQDKSVKLWSIKTIEESSSCQWTYKAHVKPIQDVCLLKFGGLIASTDSSVHIWDPFRGSALHQLDWPVGGSDSSIMCLATVNHNTLVATSNSENIMRLFDVRIGQWAHHMCAWTWTSAASIRAVAVSPDSTKFAVALTNGSTSVIDTRTGRILAYSVLHHSDAIQVDWLTNDLFACTHTDHPVVLWSVTPRLRIIRRLPEVASSVTVCTNDQYVTLQNSSNRLKLYEKEDCHNEIKLKSDFIAGSISALGYLKLNRMFLVGQEDLEPATGFQIFLIFIKTATREIDSTKILQIIF
uniref:BEACH domain-containing protein n=1 Tax=Acrobeloides nanus TaxID=290746 RepID=A0A914DB57_9BILA